MRRLIDVSHSVEHGMVTYKGFPAPVICDWMSREASRSRYAPGTEFQIGKIEMIANTGTYVDSPFHRYEKRKGSGRASTGIGCGVGLSRGARSSRDDVYRRNPAAAREG